MKKLVNLLFSSLRAFFVFRFGWGGMKDFNQIKMMRVRGTAANKKANDLTVAGNLLQSVGNALQVFAGAGDS
jgi:hypothetical protein